MFVCENDETTARSRPQNNAENSPMELVLSASACTVLSLSLLVLTTTVSAWNASETPQGHGPEVLIVSGAQNGIFPAASRDVLLGQLAAFSEFAGARGATGPRISLQLRFGSALIESVDAAIEEGFRDAAARNRSVVTVLGPETSNPSLLAAALLKRYPGIPHLTQIATVETLGDRQRFPSYFRMSSSTDTVARAMLLQLQRLGRTRFSYVVNNNAYGYSARSSMEKVAAELGITPATRTVHSPGEDDFATMVEHIHGAAVRSIFLWLTADDIDAFVLAAQNAGMDLRNDYTVFISLIEFDSIEAQRKLGGNLVLACIADLALITPGAALLAGRAPLPLFGGSLLLAGLAWGGFAIWRDNAAQRISTALTFSVSS